MVVEPHVTCGGSWEIQSAQSPTGELQGIAHGRGQPLVSIPQIMGHHSSPSAELPVGQPLVNNVGPGNCGCVGERRVALTRGRGE